MSMEYLYRVLWLTPLLIGRHVFLLSTNIGKTSLNVIFSFTISSKVCKQSKKGRELKYDNIQKRWPSTYTQ